jgi:hypothetical protein
LLCKICIKVNIILDTDISKVKITINKNIFLVLSLLIFNRTEVIIFSPSIILCLASFILFINKKTLLLTILFITISIIQMGSEYYFIIKSIGKFIFLIGSLSLIKFFKKPLKFPIFTILILFLIEFILRIRHNTLDFFSTGWFYSFKGTASNDLTIYQDSNFTSFFLSVIIVSLIEKSKITSLRMINFKYITYLLLFTVMFCLTFSRTGVIFLFFFVLSRYHLKLSILCLFVMTISLILLFTTIDTLSFIDGSLETKKKIFNTFCYILYNDPLSLLFGLGSEKSVKISIALWNYRITGHTIFGQIVEYGVIIYSFYYYTVYTLIKKLYGKNYLFMLVPCIGAGVTGLFPLSYIGLISFLYYFTTNSCSKTKYQPAQENILIKKPNENN